MDRQDYIIALLERIAFQTQGGNLGFEDYLERIVKMNCVGVALPPVETPIVPEVPRKRGRPAKVKG